ncbi:MAG: hypothetical protein WCA91_02055, partial [Candidatus Acidiferrales bacterium]
LVPQRPIYNGNNKRRGNTEGGSYSALRTRSLSFMKNLHVERIQFLELLVINLVCFVAGRRKAQRSTDSG